MPLHFLILAPDERCVHGLDVATPEKRHGPCACFLKRGLSVAALVGARPLTRTRTGLGHQTV